MAIKKEKIPLNKIDIMIYILALSSIIPLLFKSYVSLSGTVDIIVKYICILNLYSIIKIECKKNPQYTKIIINTIIISILVLCLIGIDEMYANYLEGFKKIIHYKSIKYDEKRLGSLFAYPNTMAIMCVAGIFLSLGQIWQTKKVRNKIIYIAIAIIMLITMLLTYSRMVYILFIMASIVFLFLLAQKYKKKIKFKNIIIGTTIIVIGILYLIIGLQISDKIVISKEYQKILYTVNPNQEYKFCFEVETNGTSKEDDIFEIRVTEKNRYFDTIETTKIEFGTYKGKKEIQITTKEQTAVIYLNISKKEEASNFTVKEASINGEKLILKYKILPTSMVQKIEGISIKNKSFWERAIFIKDGIIEIKDNWLLGQGGKAWETIQQKVQSYNYYAKEMHSFPLKIFLENGIIGFLAYIGLAIYILEKLIKETKKEEVDISIISTILALLVISVHSLFDFDMSFFYVAFIVSTIIALISSKEEKEIVGNNIVYILMIVSSIFSIYYASIQIHFKYNISMLKVNSVWTEERILKTYHQLAPYDQDIKMRYYRKIKENKSQMIKNLITTEKYDDSNVTLENIYVWVRRSLRKQRKYL